MAACGGHEGGGTCPFCVANDGTVNIQVQGALGPIAPDLRPDDIERDADVRWWRAKRLAELGGDAA